MKPCRSYLAELKWKDGFKCRKYSHISGHRNAKRGYYCYKCHHVESPTADTLFHRVRFGLRKAFRIIFEMASSRGMSSIQVGLRYGIQQKSACGEDGACTATNVCDADTENKWITLFIFILCYTKTIT